MLLNRLGRDMFVFRKLQDDVASSCAGNIEYEYFSLCDYSSSWNKTKQRRQPMKKPLPINLRRFCLCHRFNGINTTPKYEHNYHYCNQ